MNLAKQMVDKKDSRMRKIAENVFELRRAEVMAAVNLERGGTEGGVFPQAGTNLDAPISAKKLMGNGKKSPQKWNSHNKHHRDLQLQHQHQQKRSYHQGNQL